MSQPITTVVCGAGQRAYYAYGPYALQHPEDLRFVAVAEPDPAPRDRFGDEHGIPAERRFASWQKLFDAGRLADACLNTTQDQLHLESTLAALVTKGRKDHYPCRYSSPLRSLRFEFGLMF